MNVTWAVSLAHAALNDFCHGLQRRSSHNLPRIAVG